METSLSRLSRRQFMGGTTALAASLLRSSIAHAQAGPPKRLLVIHYPCGTVPSLFFPSAGPGLTLSPILSPFERLKSDMVVLGEVNNPALEEWQGDAHGRGVISFMTGKRFQRLPGFGMNGDAADSQHIIAADRSIDQLLASSSPLLRGTARASVQLGGSRNLTSSAGLPGQRCLTYTGPGTTGAIYPEVRPEVAVMNLFGGLASTGTTMDSAALQRARAQNQGVLAFVNKDLARLKAQVPVSQRARLDEHLSAIAQLEAQIGSSPGTVAQGCKKPALSPLPALAPGAADDAQHESISRQMLGIIKAAFLCDVTRVATFGFANAVSGISFSRVIPGFSTADAHHELTHGGRESDPAKAAVEKFYCGLVAELLVDMKNTPDGAGTSLLDNTLVVLFTEVNDGNEHGSTNMPVVLFGGKSLGLAGGRYVKLGGRFMNDVWTAVAKAFGVPLATFGDPMFNKGPAPGLFA